MVPLSTPPPVSAGLIAIVVPGYNEAKVIGPVVAGVVAYYPFVIVVDDCSTDATAAQAASAGAMATGGLPDGGGRTSGPAEPQPGAWPGR